MLLHQLPRHHGRAVVSGGPCHGVAGQQDVLWTRRRTCFACRIHMSRMRSAGMAIMGHTDHWGRVSMARDPWVRAMAMACRGWVRAMELGACDAGIWGRVRHHVQPGADGPALLPRQGILHGALIRGVRRPDGPLHAACLGLPMPWHGVASWRIRLIRTRRVGLRKQRGARSAGAQSVHACSIAPRASGQAMNRSCLSHGLP
jgi:hypothetical protein